MTERIVVTGAGSGIGRACAEELARRDLEVVCVGRRTSQLDETAAFILGSQICHIDRFIDQPQYQGIRQIGSGRGRHPLADENPQLHAA